MKLEQALAAMPVVAILRGVRARECVAIGEALVAAGILAIEVPLNSPAAFESIGKLAAALDRRAAVGAGTVLTADEAAAVADAGGSFVVAPDTRTSVIRAALGRGLEPVPGFATPTEALRAIRAGARWLKLFPAASLGMAFIGALRAVLPPDVRIIAVGGVDAANARQWLAAGAAGLGTGTSLYRAGRTTADVAAAATALAAAARAER
jgi:2-dehydro-3-deoxyphosphogalactonate aldolase